MKDKPRFSIVMPCLNEAETLEICIKKAQLFFATEKIE
jgi:glycosyltransferase involved in cell wall biosynthesis